MKTKKKKQTHYYTVACSHAGDYDDETLEAAVGKRTDGSGTGFGLRDMDWSFNHLQQALRAFKALSKYKFIERLSIEYVRAE